MGLIGGSMAKAVKKNTDYKVLVSDINKETEQQAIKQFVADGVLDYESITECDILIIALYPDACVSFLEEYKNRIPKSCIVFDCAGTKTKVCKKGFEIARQCGFCFIGAHPMAGIEKSGFPYHHRYPEEDYSLGWQ